MFLNSFIERSGKWRYWQSWNRWNRAYEGHGGFAAFERNESSLKTEHTKQHLSANTPLPSTICRIRTPAAVPYARIPAAEQSEQTISISISQVKRKLPSCPRDFNNNNSGNSYKFFQLGEAKKTRLSSLSSTAGQRGQVSWTKRTQKQKEKKNPPGE